MSVSAHQWLQGHSALLLCRDENFSALGGCLCGLLGSWSGGVDCVGDGGRGVQHHGTLILLHLLPPVFS